MGPSFSVLLVVGCSQCFSSCIPWYMENRGELLCGLEVFSNFRSSIVGTWEFYPGLDELWHTAITCCPEPSACYPQAQLAGAWAATASFSAPLQGQIPGKIYYLSKLEKLSLLTAWLCCEDQVPPRDQEYLLWSLHVSSESSSEGDSASWWCAGFHMIRDHASAVSWRGKRPWGHLI